MCKSGSKCCVPLDNYQDKPPADLRIPNGHKNQTMSKPTKTASSMASNSNSHSQRPKQPMKPITSKPTKPHEPLRESIEGNQISHRPCDGECVSGLFALFCDGLDEDAYCPNEGSCCIGTDNSNSPATTPRPVREFLRFFFVK